MKSQFFFKIFKILLILLRFNFSFSLKRKKYVIFDNTSVDEFSNLFSDQDVFVLNNRLDNIKKIYLSKKIIFFLTKNLFKYKLKLNYFIAIISEINPEIVISIIDNSPEFWKLANHFENQIKFIGVQNATRGDLIENEDAWDKETFFTNYVCFSEFDIKAVNSLTKIKVKKYFIGGSIRNSNFQIKIKKDHYKPITEKYDICFISKQDLSEKEGEKGRRQELIDLLEITATYVKKFRKKIIIAAKRNYNPVEENLYNKIFSGSLFKINWRTDKFKSYEAIESSEITIGLSSTILREAFLYKTKIICCEYRKRENYWDPFSSLNLLTNISYNNLEKRLNLLFKLNFEDYYQQLDNKKDYYMANINTNNFLKNLINNKDQLI